MDSVLVVGGGLAGLACAHTLGAEGVRVSVLDKGKRLGGRCATRRDATGVVFDHGAQYVTARDAGFRSLVDAAVAAGAAARWDIPGRDGDAAFVGTPGMRAIPAFLARGTDVTQSAQVGWLHRHADGWRARVFAADTVAPGHVLDSGGTLTDRFEAVALAIPAAQAVRLLSAIGHAFAGPMRIVRHAPCLAAMLTFGAPVDAPDVIRPQHGPLGWMSRQSARPGNASVTEPDAWVLHATGEASESLLDADDALETLVAAFHALTGAGEPVTRALHLWRYAQVTTALGEPCLYDPVLRLGVCGDGLLAARAEAAYVSGVALAQRMLA